MTVLTSRFLQDLICPFLWDSIAQVNLTNQLSPTQWTSTSSIKARQSILHPLRYHVHWESKNSWMSAALGKMAARLRSGHVEPL